MITLDLWRLSHPDAPNAASYGPRARCEEWRDRNPLRRPIETYGLDPVPYCGCCGASFVSTTTWDGGATRCAKHHDRNPCAIEGCKRTTSVPASGRRADDSWFCGEHWRRFCPPHSRRRRAYNAFWRKAKRHGWTPDLVAQFHRFWDTLVANARAKAAGGAINVAEITRLFGWDAEGPC